NEMRTWGKTGKRKKVDVPRSQIDRIVNECVVSSIRPLRIAVRKVLYLTRSKHSNLIERSELRATAVVNVHEDLEFPRPRVVAHERVIAVAGNHKVNPAA